MNGLLIPILALASLTGVSGANVAPRAAFKAADWSLSTGGDVSSYYTISEDSILASASQTGMRDNFLLYEADSYLGDYSVKIEGKGETAWPVTKNIQIGLVPWYLDPNNYLVVYMEWSPTERPSGMRVVEFTGRIDGKAPVVYKDGGFVEAEWNDAWMDGANEGFAVSPDSSWTFEVKKERSAAGDTDEFSAYINGNKVGFYGFRDLPKYSTKPSKVGIYTYNENLEITSFEVTESARTDLYHEVTPGIVAKSASGDWTINDKTYAIDETTASGVASTMALGKNPYEGNYELKATFPETALVDKSAIGLVAWYNDETNYAVAYILDLGGKRTLYIEGLITVYGAGGTMNQTPIYESLELDESAQKADQDGNIAIIAQKKGNTISVYLENDRATVLTASNAAFASSNMIGTAVSGMNVTFTYETASIQYQAFDWRVASVGGQLVNVKSATDDDSVFSYEGGTYTVDDLAVKSGDQEGVAGLYFSTRYVGNISVSATFAALQDGQEYGLYAFLVDVDNYVRVALSKSAITVYVCVNGVETPTTNALPEGFDALAPHELSTELKRGVLNVSLDGTSVVEGFVLNDFDFSEALATGFFFEGKGGSLNSLTYTGFLPNSTVKEGDWSLNGPRPDTWTIDEENGTVTGKLDGGTVWQQTNALISNEKTDFWCGATVNVSEVTASEHKVGLVPYYVDSNNYVFVWFSRWAGSTPNVNTTVRVNGQIIPPEWGEREVGIQFDGADNKLEAHIEGDTISVYVGGTFAPVYQGEYPGLSARRLSGAKSGFNISNVSATFKDFALGVEERVYSYNEKPVIAEVGTRVTEAYLGDSVRLPIYTASNSNYDPLNAIVNVTDPTDNPVTLVSNAFTAEKLGAYHVSVTCVDDWGNEADPIEYDITVTEKPATGEGESSTAGGGTDVTPTEPENDNLGLILGLVFGGIGVLLLVGLGVYLYMRQRNKKAK